MQRPLHTTRQHCSGFKSQHAAEFTSITMQVAAAAGSGQLANLKWLRAHGCPHDISAVSQTLLHNNSATPPSAAWVRSCGGGDWSPHGMTLMLEAALLDATPTMARWLRAEGARWPEDLAEVVATDIKHLTPSTIVWAVQQGCPFGRWTSQVCDLLESTCAGSGAAKRALHDLGCPCACPRPHKL
ncbi:hypothetical protein JKP88DRAFT_244309 [Tribonema minus]|uniref:Uncharacterized protein n=1 Tax=Tribonema minus TaxID=303371 RepID=A0A835Z1B9_9STRA|nr:hypothetical protein JKP88DRAFT_244309 [Tribonema minus]